MGANLLALPGKPAQFLSHQHYVSGPGAQWSQREIKSSVSIKMPKEVSEEFIECFLGVYKNPLSQKGNRAGWISALPPELELRMPSESCQHPAGGGKDGLVCFNVLLGHSSLSASPALTPAGLRVSPRLQNKADVHCPEWSRMHSEITGSQ